MRNEYFNFSLKLTPNGRYTYTGGITVKIVLCNKKRVVSNEFNFHRKNGTIYFYEHTK